MWMVVRDLDYEAIIEKFETEEEAADHFETLKEFTNAPMYLVEIKETFNVRNDN